MRKLKIVFLLCSIGLFSSYALSDSPVSNTRIIKIGTYSNSDRIYVTTGKNGSAVNPFGCSAHTFVLSKADANFKEMYSSLLTSLSLSGNVDLRISSSTCIGPYPKISYVGIVSE